VEYVCRKCEDRFDSPLKIKDYYYCLCPYCYSVEFIPDKDWLPEISKEGADKIKRGFQKIKTDERE